jgi:hypothetical protein
VQPPASATQPVAPTIGVVAPPAPAGASTVAVSVPPHFAADWTTQFATDRAGLASSSGDQAAMTMVELQNLDSYWAFEQDLAANRSPADVLWALEADHRAHECAIAPRTGANDVAIRNVRRVIADPAGSGVPQAGSVTVLNALYVCDLAYTAFDDVNKTLVVGLRRVIRRGKRRRFFWESVHTVVALVVFNLLFGSVSEAMCEWMQRVTGFTLSARICSDVRFATILVLFVAERWALGPRVDEWIAKRTRRATAEACGFYYRDRTHQEYQLTILETEIARTRANLQSIGVTI